MASLPGVSLGPSQGICETLQENPLPGLFVLLAEFSSL